ncbi:MAG TPA: ATP-binding cassette domain-containing protein [Myxococcota bacterium]|nr:ATP-binding cassette domain-containing protein [Myxococcota bacterium]
MIGLLFLLPVVWMGLEPGAMALGLGGLLLAGGALGGLVGGLDRLLSAAVAWERVAPLWRAADRQALPGEVQTGLALAREPAVVGQRVLDAQGISFHFPGRTNLLTGVGVELRAGDRVLVEGPSGGGKSTLASLLAALRRPQEGMILLRGYDLPSVGELTWRRMVATAPQFHENHIFSQSLAFNLLMGAGWPASPQQQADAARLCEELGLGPLLQRMPAGLRQQVGETGWQLSHGERSRVYLARALLQGAEVVILDESFGALDPETQVQALRTARRVAKTLVVIAHP